MEYRTKVYLFAEAETDEELDLFAEELGFEGRLIKKKRHDGSHYYEIGTNFEYEPYVSDMIRASLGSLFQRPKEMKALKEKHRCRTMLTIVPYLEDSEEPQQCLSLDKDIIEWLYLSDSEMDLDYYLV